MAGSDALLGRTLAGRWRLDEVLGRGGMGAVYRATETATGRPVAVKVLHPSMVAQGDMLARFEREARVMSRLNHPNLVPLLALEHDGDVHFLVMRYAEGESLSTRLKERGRHTVREALPILAQLGSALDYLHARGIVHRDVKPANVILSAAGHVTLLDFGISRPLDSSLTRAGAVLGTPQYMAPEQAIGDTVDHRADLYALGLIAYHLVTGEPPFGKTDTFEAIRRHLFETPQLASEKSAAVSEALARVLARALAKKPSERYESAQAFQEALVEAFAADSTEQSTNARKDVTQREEAPLATTGATSPVLDKVYAASVDRPVAEPSQPATVPMRPLGERRGPVFPPLPVSGPEGGAKRRLSTGVIVAIVVAVVVILAVARWALK